MSGIDTTIEAVGAPWARQPGEDVVGPRGDAYDAYARAPATRAPKALIEFN